MNNYSFLKENHGFSISQPLVDNEGNPSGEMSISHSESPDGNSHITKMTSHRQWERKLDENDLEPFFSMFHGFQDKLRNCDGFGEEDMLIRTNIIPQIKYQFKRHCSDNNFDDTTSDLFRYTSDHIVRDLEDELDKESDCNTENLLKFLDCKNICL